MDDIRPPAHELTPMMRQYHEIKNECRDAILFFRLGDFYEMFGPDALEASKILDITLTARNKQNAGGVPMCGIPYHAAENYIDKLTKAGKKVAICEQVSDPSLPGIVQRKIVRIVTPGTTLSDQVLERGANRFILSIFPKKDYFGFAFADLSTGEFQAAEWGGKEILIQEIARLNPAEIVLHREHYDDPDFRAFIVQNANATLSACDLYEDAYRLLLEHFHLQSLDAFGIGNKPFAIQAAGVLLTYLLDTQKESITHIDRITAYQREQCMALDEATIRNLELFGAAGSEASNEVSVWTILDQSETPMGARLLRKNLLRPLLKKEEIEARLNAVEDLVKNTSLRLALKEDLKKIGDLERLLARLSTGSGNARDLLGLARSLQVIPSLKSHLAGQDSKAQLPQAPLLKSIETDLLPLTELTEELLRALVDEPPFRITEGGMIRPGYHTALDDLIGLSKEGKTALKNIELAEIQATGINSLKVGFNKVFGYFIEISKVNLSKVPDRYIRKQTLANAERYITPELKEYEEKVLHADEQSIALEQDLFFELRGRVLAEVKDIKQNAEMVADLDFLYSLAQAAIRYKYVRPEIISAGSESGERGPIFEVEDGRHPVVEETSALNRFIPNPLNFKRGEVEIKLITGPNMSGKSTYLRQAALIALMAQIGSFVPAARARLTPFDRIFTRVGANDNLARGQSTFMVEMQECAYILNHATDRSLIILDEVGRGTSTYDGLSLAWAIFEALHDSTRAFTLFATHYHELIALAERLLRAKNYSVEVRETAKGVLFLHKIAEGGIHKSYGIEVAKLAGMPHGIVDRAAFILDDLETEKILSHGKLPENQMNLFIEAYRQKRETGLFTHPALEKLKGLDINQLTPLDALNALSELKSLDTRNTPAALEPKNLQ